MAASGPRVMSRATRPCRAAVANASRSVPSIACLLGTSCLVAMARQATIVPRGTLLHQGVDGFGLPGVRVAADVSVHHLIAALVVVFPIERDGAEGVDLAEFHLERHVVRDETTQHGQIALTVEEGLSAHHRNQSRSRVRTVGHIIRRPDAFSASSRMATIDGPR